MKTAQQLDTLEKIAYETGLRGDDLQEEFFKREAMPLQAINYAKRVVDHLRWLYGQRDRDVEFKAYAADILGMTVEEYLHGH
jgi:hypothetical protein